MKTVFVRQLIVLLVAQIFTKYTPCHAAIKLPYEVENTILDHTDPSEYVSGLDKVNVSDANITREIYRKDLPPDYIAYYEIESGGKYVVLSSGPKTGDYRETESGPCPRPTDVLIQQARKHGQECSKFFRLSSFGLMFCQNERGRAVAATFNWTSDVAEISDWRKLDQMVTKDSKLFTKSWRQWAAEVKESSEWKTTEIKYKNKILKEFEEEVIAPGSAVKVALKKDFETVSIYVYRPGKPLSKISFEKLQPRLCQVLVNICKNNETLVNKEAIKMTSNGLPYLQLEVKRKGVRQILKNKEVGFVVAISSNRDKTVIKHYSIDLTSSRRQRSVGSGVLVSTGSWRQWTIPRENLFPDYNQHKCCGGCWSGCTPVAWAQIFAYYDKLAHSSTTYGHSKNLFRCGGGSWGSARCVAPGSMNPSVETFVEDLRNSLGTYCRNGAGATRRSAESRIENWYKAREGRRAKLLIHRRRSGWWFFGKRSTVGSTTIYGKSGRYRNKVIDALKRYPAYPAKVSIDVASNGGKKGGHAAVVTKYRRRCKVYRVHRCRKVGWWWGRKTKCGDEMVTRCDDQFYYHMGWGGSANAWHKALAIQAGIAKPY